ncbi:MAG: ribosome maturation factor RimP [Gammaproteobacteria bacterium]|nr:MAG: ribosome maturation factor RimP [Gammaproteobacteria bacterium]
MRKIDPALHDKLVTLINSMGYEMVGGELFPQGGATIFRIYIDRPTGVTLDDCSLVSRQVSAMMDVEDPVRGRYVLEVSSPGVNRPLFELEHYRKFIGHRVKIRLHAPVHERRQFKGVLTRVEGDEIYLLIDDSTQEVSLPFSAIEKANLIEDIRF